MITRVDSSHFIQWSQSDRSAEAPSPLVSSAHADVVEKISVQKRDTALFLQERERADRLKNASEQRLGRLDTALQKVEEKKEAVESLLHMSVDELKEGYYQARKHRWTSKAMGRDPFLCFSGAVSLGIPGIQVVAWVTVLPLSLIIYHFRGNDQERAWKDALFAPQKLEAKHEKLCAKAEKLRRNIESERRA